MSDLRLVPGIGAKKEKELIELGYDSLEKLKDANPDEVYWKMGVKQGYQPDKCVLYAVRCAVAFANDPDPDPNMYRWWYFCDTQESNGDTKSKRKSFSKLFNNRSPQFARRSLPVPERKTG